MMVIYVVQNEKNPCHWKFDWNNWVHFANKNILRTHELEKVDDELIMESSNNYCQLCYPCFVYWTCVKKNRWWTFVGECWCDILVCIAGERTLFILCSYMFCVWTTLSLSLRTCSWDEGTSIKRMDERSRGSLRWWWCAQNVNILYDRNFLWYLVCRVTVDNNYVLKKGEISFSKKKSIFSVAIKLGKFLYFSRNSRFWNIAGCNAVFTYLFLHRMFSLWYKNCQVFK